MSFYDTERALAEYLMFHYGTEEQVLPRGLGPREALHFPARCVSECVDFGRLPERARALDLGCAVGGASFELARHFYEVIGLDSSLPFVAAAKDLARSGRISFNATVEGTLIEWMEAVVPEGIDRGRVRFEVGDAMRPPKDLGSFNLVLAANLIDRLQYPSAFLRRLGSLTRPGGQLVVTSPYTWLTQYTPKEEWLGGRLEEGVPVRSPERVREILGREFDLLSARDLPFLIREHERKYQWSVAEATTWRRR